MNDPLQAPGPQTIVEHTPPVSEMTRPRPPNPLRKRNPFLVALVVGIPTLIAMIVISAIVEQRAQTAEPDEFREKQASEAYRRNEVGADQIYKGRRWLIKGTVKSVSSQRNEEHVLHMEDSENEVTRSLTMSATQSRKVGSLSLGDGVRLSCRLDGKGWLSFNFSECLLLSPRLPAQSAPQ